MGEVKVYVTAFDLLKEEFEEKNTPIITFSETMDKVMGGGIYFKMITEIFGEKGQGKTTLCLQLALTIQIPKSLSGLEAQCIFIDTENTFVLHRLKTMATKFAEHCGTVSPPSSSSNRNHPANKWKVTADSLINGIHYFNCRSTEELEELIQNLDDYLTQHSKIRLIIIDSLAFIYYSMSSDFDSRTKSLYTLSQGLRSLMNKFNLAIVVTNSMTTRFDSQGQDYHVPFLGESWTYIPNRRIQLGMEGDSRTATLIKCPMSTLGSGQYSITSSGIRD